jgi:O-antigen ligase
MLKSFTTSLRRHWRGYRRGERLFVLLPLLVLTPRLVPDLSLGHNGEPTQEFVFALASCATLAAMAAGGGFTLARRDLPLLAAVGLFAAWSAASLGWTASGGDTLHHTGLWVVYGALLVAGRGGLRRRARVGLGCTLTMTLLALALLRLAEFWMTGDARSLVSSRYANIGVEPELIVTLLALALVTALTARRRGAVWFGLLTATAAWMGALSTYQRTPLLALLGILAVLLAAAATRRLRPRGAWRVAALASLLVAATGWQMSVQSGLPGFTGLGFIRHHVGGVARLESDTSSRLLYWGVAAEMLRAHPAAGVGAGSFQAGYAEHHARAVTRPYLARVVAASDPDNEAVALRAHNEYVQVTAELGLAGLMLLGLTLAALAALLWRPAREGRLPALCVLTGAVAFLISSGLTSFSFRWLPCGAIFFLLTALAPRRSDLKSGKVASSATSFEPQPQPTAVRSAALALAALCALASFGAARVMLSQFYQARGEQEGAAQDTAERFFRQSLAANPYNYVSHFYLGRALYEARQPRAAMPHLLTGVRGRMANTYGYALLAFACEEGGERGRAGEAWREGVAAFPSSTLLRSLYADWLARGGDEAGAQEQRAVARRLNTAEAELWEAVARDGRLSGDALRRYTSASGSQRMRPAYGVTLLIEWARRFPPQDKTAHVSDAR